MVSEVSGEEGSYVSRCYTHTCTQHSQKQQKLKKKIDIVNLATKEKKKKKKKKKERKKEGKKKPHAAVFISTLEFNGLSK